MTGIQWTQAVWNPTTGCDKVSPGCGLPRFDGDDTGGCYAMTMARRLKAMGQAKYQNDGDPRTSGPGFGLTVHPDALTIPLRWRKPKLVFVNSMSDLGHARVPADFLAQVWTVMAVTPQHTYQILSKRPHRLSRVLLDSRFEADVRALAWSLEGHSARRVHWPLPNVWMGTSVELDRYCPRADSLRETPAAVRFLSLEPLLGPLPSLDLTGINWAIIGGESGGGAREMDLGWARDIISRCREAGTAVFVKQLGSRWAQANGGHSKGGDWDRWPDDLKVREFPRAPEAEAA